jgi:hypothetical protein
MWFHGPFIRFFRTQPQAALETTVSLVNFATDRCLHLVDPHWATVSVDIEFPNGKQQWTGNERTYFWSIEPSGTAGSVSCALMALERFFYEQMEAGQSIEPFVAYILSNTRSLAFAGLLLRVGRKEPSLLRGCLLPLFRVAEFYSMEVSHQLFREHGGILEPRQERQARKEWYEQPHRNIDLRTFARQLFLLDSGWRPVFEEMRQLWLARTTSAPQNIARFLRGLVAWFDPTNYREQKGDSGETVFEYVPPASLAQSDPERVRRMEQQEMITSAFSISHGILTGELPPSSFTVQDLWHRLDLIGNFCQPNENPDFEEAFRACCALAAVLIEFHRDWLRTQPDGEATCTTILLHAATARPPTRYHGGPDLQDLHPFALAARALPSLWKDSPHTRRLRSVLARLVLCGNYSVVRTLMLSAARHRDSLKQHFQQLEWLVQGFAVALHLDERQQNSSNKEFDLEKWCREQSASFIKGRLRSPGVSLSEVAKPDLSHLIPDHQGHTGRRDIGIDIECLLACYSWAGDLSTARSPADRRHFIDIHRQILDCAMAAFRVNVPDDQADFYGPYKPEKELIKTIASLLLQLGDDEDARQFWQPIIDLAPKSRLWGMSFISDLTLPCFENPALVPKLRRVWGEMLDFAFQSPAWLVKQTWGNRGLSELWRDLLRVEFTFWSGDDAPTVILLRFLAPYLERWALLSLHDSRNAVALIELLRVNAATFLRCDALLWLGKTIPVNEEWEWDDKEFQDDLGGFLALLADRHGTELRSRPEAYATFLAFATRLAAMQHGLAVELLQRMNR